MGSEHNGMAQMQILLGLFMASVVAAQGVSLPPGIKAGLYGDAVGHSDFQLNLRQPEESTRDVEESLDALLKFEESKAEAARAEAAASKQRMLNIEKAKIRDIVSTAFAPLMAKAHSL